MLPISFSRFKHFQFQVVDSPTPLEIVSLAQYQALMISHSILLCRRLPPSPEIVCLTQEQALLISCSRLLSNCITSKKMYMGDRKTILTASAVYVFLFLPLTPFRSVYPVRRTRAFFCLRLLTDCNMITGLWFIWYNTKQAYRMMLSP